MGLISKGVTLYTAGNFPAYWKGLPGINTGLFGPFINYEENEVL